MPASTTGSERNIHVSRRDSNCAGDGEADRIAGVRRRDRRAQRSRAGVIQIGDRANGAAACANERQHEKSAEKEAKQAFHTRLSWPDSRQRKRNEILPGARVLLPTPVKQGLF